MEPYSKTISELREWDHDVWTKAEALSPKNSLVFASILGVHYDLLMGAHERGSGQEPAFERALRLMAARCTHLLRATWISSMTGYSGAHQPLVRALLETSLTMHYLSQFPSEFTIWSKSDRSFAEQRRFWPRQMLKRMKAPESEFLILSRLADAAHPNPPSLSRLAGYDPCTDTVDASVGQVPTAEEALRTSWDTCLFGVISAYNIARSVEGALGDGIPTGEELSGFLGRLDSLLKSAKKPPQASGPTVFDMLADRT